MDPRLEKLYEDELRYLQGLGTEFAKLYPKVAGRLGMSPVSGIEIADPYVERLLEGVAFLAARVQLKMDAEFPRFTQALLEIVYPHYLAPTPSMLVAQLKPDRDEPNLARGFTVPRGTAMHATRVAEDTTAPQFRTAHDVTLWPLELTSASYFSFAPDLPLASLPYGTRIKGGVRIKLRTTAGLKMRELALDRIRFYLTGHDGIVSSLYELILGCGIGGLVLPPKSPPAWTEILPASAVQPVGFADNEALLPVNLRSFQGYRLLQEYFAFPQRFLFFEIGGLKRALSRADGEEIEIVWLFNRGNPQLERDVDVSNFALFCTPAINLFEKRADRIQVNNSTHEFHVVPDRTRPEDFEVYQVTDVVGHGAGADSEQQFRPFYSTWSGDADRPHSAYFTTRREGRLPSEREKKWGTRSSYFGTEVFLSLVDSSQAPFDQDLRQLSVHTLCTNRDLVLHMPIGTGHGDLGLDIAAPVTDVRIVSRASAPMTPKIDGTIAWRAISHLSLNYLSLTDATPEQGASALRDLLDLYVADDDATGRRQVEGLRSVHVNRVVRRLPSSGPIAFGRGLEISVTIDHVAFEGGGAFLFGSVLNHYFRRYVSLNSFTETVLRSSGRGELNRWVPQWGARPTL